jgi:hypothetical protein
MNVDDIVDGEKQIYDRYPQNERPLSAERSRAEKPVLAMGTADKPSAGNEAFAVRAIIELPAFVHFPVLDVLLQRCPDIEVRPAVGALDVHGLEIVPHHFLPARLTLHHYHRSFLRPPSVRERLRHPPSARDDIEGEA